MERVSQLPLWIPFAIAVGIVVAWLESRVSRSE
jgi:hypothetical protein